MGDGPERIGRYEILATVGRGAMGIVYKARDPVIDRVVAIKQIALSPGLSPEGRAEFTRRFFREAKAAGKLQHPNVVTIYDMGEEEGSPFMAMEFVEGVSLGQLLKTRGSLPPGEALALTRQIARGLAYAHEQGVVHRDVKPDNILVDAKGRAVVTDFGVAHLEASDMTRTGEILGTPHFMSPEQVTGQPLDGRSDLFSLGVVLFQILSGDRPFKGDTVSTICYHIVHSSPQPDIDQLGLHPRLAALLARLLAKRREERYADGESLVLAIDSVTGAMAGEATLPADATADWGTMPNRAAGGLSEGAPPAAKFDPTVIATPRRVVSPSSPPKKTHVVANTLIYGVFIFLLLVVAGGLVMRLAGKAKVKPGKTEARLEKEKGEGHKVPPGPTVAPAGLEAGSQDGRPRTSELPHAASGAGGQATANRKQPDADSFRPPSGSGRAQPEGRAVVGMAQVSVELAGPIMAGGFGIFVDGEPRVEKEIHGAVNKRNPEKQGFRVRESLELTAGTHTLRFAVKAARSGSIVLIKDWTVSPKAGDHLRLQVQAFPRKATLLVKEVPGFEPFE